MNKNIQKSVILTPVIMVIFTMLIAMFDTSIQNASVGYKNTIFFRFLSFIGFYSDLANIWVAIWLVYFYKNPSNNTKLYRAIRNIALSSITITMLVYNLFMVKNEPEQTFLVLLSIKLFHILIPLWALFIWLFIDKTRKMDLRSIGYSCVFFFVYIIYTLIVGQLTGYYPYGTFVDPHIIGYTKIAIIASYILAILLIINFILYFIEWILFRKKNI